MIGAFTILIVNFHAPTGERATTFITGRPGDSPSQATLSRQIALLEDEIGAELFIRHKNGVTLTPAGQYLFKSSHSLLEQYKDIVFNCRRAVSDLSPRLRIGLGPLEHLLLTGPLTGLLKQYPAAEVDCMSYTYKILTSRFRNKSIDVGLCTERCAKAVEGLYLLPVYKEPWQVAASANHPYWQLPASEQACIQDQNLLIGYQNEFEETVLYCERNHFKPGHFIECNFLQSQIPLLQAGAGIALLPPFVREALPADVRMEDRLTVPLAPTIVLAHYPHNTHPALQALRRLYAEEMSDG